MNNPKDCPHPIVSIRLYKSGKYYCTLCASQIKHINFLACEHGMKIGVCSKCRKSQKMVGDFLKKPNGDD